MSAARSAKPTARQRRLPEAQNKLLQMSAARSANAARSAKPPEAKAMRS